MAEFSTRSACEPLATRPDGLDTWSDETAPGDLWPTDGFDEQLAVSHKESTSGRRQDQWPLQGTESAALAGVRSGIVQHKMTHMLLAAFKSIHLVVVSAMQLPRNRRSTQGHDIRQCWRSIRQHSEHTATVCYADGEFAIVPDLAVQIARAHGKFLSEHEPASCPRPMGHK